MNEGNALIYAYLLDGKGGGEAVDWTAIDNWNPSQGLLWIHLDSKMPETRIWLEKQSGRSQITQESLLDQKAVSLIQQIPLEESSLLRHHSVCDSHVFCGTAHYHNKISPSDGHPGCPQSN